jgi:hypothetical protein
MSGGLFQTPFQLIGDGRRATRCRPCVGDFVLVGGGALDDGFGIRGRIKTGGNDAKGQSVGAEC